MTQGWGAWVGTHPEFLEAESDVGARGHGHRLELVLSQPQLRHHRLAWLWRGKRDGWGAGGHPKVGKGPPNPAGLTCLVLHVVPQADFAARASPQCHLSQRQGKVDHGLRQHSEGHRRGLSTPNPARTAGVPPSICPHPALPTAVPPPWCPPSPCRGAEAAGAALGVEHSLEPLALLEGQVVCLGDTWQGGQQLSGAGCGASASPRGHVPAGTHRTCSGAAGPGGWHGA